MTTSQFSYTLGAGSQTQLRRQQTCQAVHDGLIAAGLVQTNDTGQLDFSTIPAPTASAVTFGWRMYELIDSFTPSTRFLIKIFFLGRAVGGGAANNEVVFEVVAGTATDGEGNFIGSSITVAGRRAGSAGAAQKPSSIVQCYVCAKEGYVGLALGLQAFNTSSAPSPTYMYGNACFAVLSRTKSKEGVYDDRGLVGLGAGTGFFENAIGTNGDYTTVQFFTSNTAMVSGLTIQDKTELCAFPGNISELFSIDGDLFLHHLSAAAPWIYPVHELAIYPSHQTYSVGDKFKVNIAGVERTLIALGSVNLAPGSVSVPRSGAGVNIYGFMHPFVGVAMLWE